MKKFKRGSFRLVHRCVWDGVAKLEGATSQEIIVYLYLETGPLSHYSGLFHVFPVDIARYTRLAVADVKAALNRLQKRSWIVHDSERQLVFVRGMLKRQLGTQSLNEDNAAGIAYYVERMEFDSPAITAFMQENRDDVSEFAELLDGSDPPPPPPGTPRGATPPGDPNDETLRLRNDETLKRRDVETARRKDDESVAAAKGAASTRPPSKSSRLSPRKAEGKSEKDPPAARACASEGAPLAAGTPGNGNGKAKASGKEVVDVLSTLPGYHASAIAEARKNEEMGEWTRQKTREKLIGLYKVPRATVDQHFPEVTN